MWQSPEIPKNNSFVLFHWEGKKNKHNVECKVLLWTVEHQLIYQTIVEYMLY